MKILGVSLGTKNGNNDTMCRVALEAAKEMGAEIEFIHLMDMWALPSMHSFVTGTIPSCLILPHFPMVQNAIGTIALTQQIL